MILTGRCYCGRVRYELAAAPLFRAQCHCREGQYFTGGHPHVGMAFPKAAFRYTQGEPKRFRRNDIPNAVTREFCPECGTHLLGLTPPLPDVVLIQPGTLDDPSQFGLPDIAVFTREKQSFHHVPDGIPTFETIPSQ